MPRRSARAVPRAFFVCRSPWVRSTAELIELQLTSRTNWAALPHVHYPAAGRLAAMIFNGMQ
jgi:hypothetical protein